MSQFHVLDSTSDVIAPLMFEANAINDLSTPMSVPTRLTPDVITPLSFVLTKHYVTYTHSKQTQDTPKTLQKMLLNREHSSTDERRPVITESSQLSLVICANKDYGFTSCGDMPSSNALTESDDDMPSLEETL